VNKIQSLIIKLNLIIIKFNSTHRLPHQCVVFSDIFTHLACALVLLSDGIDLNVYTLTL